MNSPVRVFIESKLWNICRFCTKNDSLKDVSAEYYFFGKKEVYEDMLKETYNIQISVDGEISNTRLICEDCIVKLREASLFKQTVLRSEQTFAEYLNCLKHADVENKSLTHFKLESIKSEVLPETCDDYHVNDDDGSLDDDEILANVKLELTKNIHNGVTDLNVESHKQKTKTKKCKMKGSKTDALKNDKDWVKIIEHRGNGPILRENSLKLLEHSTICVFQWHRSRYRCFCCKEPFSDMDNLKNHTSTKHDLKAIEKKIILQQNRLVKVEVSKLNCKLCNEPLEDLLNLREHLVTEHRIEFSLKEDLLVPFKITNGSLQCQICSENFTVFRLLNIHMNKHYQKQVCHICGAGFSNLVFLNLHKTRSHRVLNCKSCKLNFNSKPEKRNHEVNVHGVKFERKLRFPCAYCDERFFQESLRVQHLVDGHGMKKPEYECTVCAKVFITKSLCNNHVKNVHMKEKNHECDICHHRFYTKSDVLRHQVTHTGEKKFSCILCNGPFATKDSLRRHMKRTHIGVN